MGKQGRWWAGQSGFWLLGLLLTGCSLSPSSKLTLFPSGHQLTETAKDMRQPVPVALPRELDKQVLSAYIVEPGDALRIQPVNLDSPVRLPGDQVILPDGTINLFRYGRLLVAGRSVEEIEVMVRDAIAAKEPNAGSISVQLVTRVSKVYYVQGEVNAPGAFPLNGRETVLDALIAAGGLTDRASRTNIILSRPTRPDSCRIVLPVCYRDIVQLGDTTTNYQLMPGDRVYVSTRTFKEGLPWCKPKCDYCSRPHTACAMPPLADCTGHDQAPTVLHRPITLEAAGVAPRTGPDSGVRDTDSPVQK